MRTISRVGEPLRVGAARRGPRLSVRDDGETKVATRAKRVPSAVWWVLAVVALGVGYVSFAVERATGPGDVPSASAPAEPGGEIDPHQPAQPGGGT